MLALPQETRLIFFTIANNICTLLMPVYKYGIAMFYIYLYMSISISIYINIYSHTLKRDKEKDQRSPGNRFCWRAPEPSEEGRQRTALALDSHTRCPPQAGRRAPGLSRDAPCLGACFGHVTLAFAILIPGTGVLLQPWS